MRSSGFDQARWCYLENSVEGNINNHERTLITLYGSFEESLTRFARRDPVMKPARNVPANKAQPSWYHVLFFHTFLNKR